MGVPVIDAGPMTVEDFYAFTNTRPDEEKWELIDGEPVLNAWPSFTHQQIVLNILLYLGPRASDPQITWGVLPGLGVRVSNTDLPVPDVLVRPRGAPTGNPASGECDDMVVAFEALSPSTKGRDLRWKRRAYSSLSSLTHYIVIAQDAVDIVVFARDLGFEDRRLTSLDESVDLPSLDISLPLSEIYRDTAWADWQTP